ncbi:hypothetical protein DSL72_008533 [Monilinia vaccinii-corymbosi]|uniref:Beta-xylanase n=1 Tax=Monilinia vaccinii-corymbosi TaxID=61207 RepID=A0A8A3PPJ8_9HELO|nr:hypothetical protein DSL72_008533 [Monilinia vaccinii-corymbosi]
MRISTLTTLAIVPSAYAQLNTLAKAAGLKYFGSATDNYELADSQYTAILSNSNEFGQITPANKQKWDSIEPTQNTFSYTKGDVVVDLAKKNHQILRCHTLVWYNQLPSWVTAGTWTKATLIEVLKNHIKNVVTYYKGKCYAWDVVNEAFNDDGTWRSFVFYDTIGPEYIPIAFQTAALYDPDVKLYYNDYNIESAGAKATSVLNLIRSLKARGIKIDGVGLQAHLIVGSAASESSLATTLKSFTALGVEAAYTELDIRFQSLPPTTAGLAQQGVDYANVVKACLSVDGCVGITVWDLTDKYSWIPSTFRGNGDACLWFANYTLHPAYHNVVAALTAAAGTRAVTPNNPPTLKPKSQVASPSVLASSVAPLVSHSVSSFAPSVAPVTSSTTLMRCTKMTTATLSTSTRTTSTAAAATGTTVPRYGQCGGAYWTGSTTCASGYTCKVQNSYYSQCLSS